MPDARADASAVRDLLELVALRDVEVGGEIGRRIEVTIRNNLLAVDLDNAFLKPFIDRQETSSYIGLGKFFDALTRLCAYSHNHDLLERRQHILEVIAQTQETDGYFGCMVPDRRVWWLWDVHETGYLIYALCTDYALHGDPSSLEQARKMADHLIPLMRKEPDRLIENGQSVFHLATLGIDKALIELWHLTGNQKYLDFCVQRLDLADWDFPIVEGRWGDIQGHAYAYLARCLAQLLYYRVTGNDRLLAPTRRAMDFLTRQDGLAITGGCGLSECWHSSQDGTGNLQESCTTTYQLMVYDNLLRLEGDSRYGDLMERAIYNALFGAQSPDGRRIRYYTPFEGRREYFDKDTYCCPNNFRRAIALLPQLVYYRTGNGVLINLYTVSSARIDLPNGVIVSVRQKTDYPNSGQVVLHVDPSERTEFEVTLRIPGWCEKATINGDPVEPGMFITLCRTWSAGDRIAIEFSMPWRLVRGRQAQAGRVAVMRGPVVYCLNTTANEEMKTLRPTGLHRMCLDPASLKGPIASNCVRDEGLACTLRVWPTAPPRRDIEPMTLRATEFADPEGETTYLHPLDPNDERLVDDELLGAQ